MSHTEKENENKRANKNRFVHVLDFRLRGVIEVGSSVIEVESCSINCAEAIGSALCLRACEKRLSEPGGQPGRDVPKGVGRDLPRIRGHAESLRHGQPSPAQCPIFRRSEMRKFPGSLIPWPGRGGPVHRVEVLAAVRMRAGKPSGLRCSPADQRSCCEVMFRLPSARLFSTTG